ncbi:class I SAM-dependent methyltransferase [Streptosporangium sp. NPDC003464]
MLRVFTDADVAALYDVLNPWNAERPDSAFFNDLVMSAQAVLDVGCGTGSMLHQAREMGHAGRLVGLDPDRAALERARRRTDVEWVEGVAADAAWDREFELATMASNAFQCFVTDEEMRSSLVAIRAALREGGRFVFETRHPQARAWEGWNPGNATEVVDGSGRRLRVSHTVESVAGGVVSLTETTSEADGEVLWVDRGNLRFLDVPELRGFLDEAGFVVEEQFGDWTRGPVTDSSRVIIMIARRA